ncbi:hypothetical protein BDV93DRAFT_520091 [Ceratobasidium sp. AG-I]|nr:hypothetical protein BDV93DRAFT_520091 [Ceratobasidium sp. AG-I]
MATPSSALISCPYVLGARFSLEVSTPQNLLRIVHATVTEVIEPFTISPVMKVSLDDDEPGLPRQLMLKLFDRRFALSLRRYHDAKPWTFKLEAQYAAYVASGAAPVNLPAVIELCDEFYARKEEEPPELREHHIALTIEPYFKSECSVYDRLSSLQGRFIPTFYGSTRFCDDTTIPNIDLSVRGILLEFIPGTKLSSIDASLVDGQSILKSCLHIVDVCGDMGVLNRDVRLENFIVKPDESVVMIDFAQARVRCPDESDNTWRLAKGHRDEEGAVGYITKRDFGWEYTPTYKYWVSESDEEYLSP